MAVSGLQTPAYVIADDVTSDEGASEYTQLIPGSETPGVTDSNKTFSLPRNVRDIHVYKRRWYILALFSVITFSQGALWNTWAPLAMSAERAYGWGDTVLTLMTSCGGLAYLISAPFVSWLMDTKGLRWAGIYTAGMMLIGTALRCIPASPPLLTSLTWIGQLFCGLAGPFAMGGPPLVSAVWFPASQRTTATAIATGIGGMGMSLSFIMGAIYDPGHNQTDNATDRADPSGQVGFFTVAGEIEKRLRQLMYVECGCVAVVFLAVLVYFPAKPPKPPSISSARARLDYKEGLKQLFRKRGFWTLGMVYGVSTGVLYSWSAVLAVNLAPLGISQDTAGWLGFLGSTSGNIGGFFIAIFADLFKRKVKILLTVLYCCGSVGFLVFSLVCVGIIPFHVVWLYTSLVVGSVAVLGGIPLFYELVCEAVYPVAEGVANISLTYLNNVFALLFFVVLIFNSGKLWMNWCMLGAVVTCVPILLVYRQQLRRLDVDIGTEEPLERRCEEAGQPKSGNYGTYITDKQDDSPRGQQSN